MHKLLCATAMSALLCSSPAYASSSDSGTMKGELSRGEDGKIKVTPFPVSHTSAPSYASCSAIDNAPKHIVDIVNENAIAQRLDPNLILAMISVESGFKVTAQSNKVAQGLMQIIPSTQRMLGVKDPFDPADNIGGGTRYVRQLLDLHGGSVELMLSSYNSGPGNTLKYGKVSPIAETLSYVAKVQNLVSCNTGVI